MFRNKPKIFIVSALWLTCLCIVLGLKTEQSTIGVASAIQAYKENNAAFANSAISLKTAVSSLSDGDTAAVLRVRAALRKSRMDYKRIEFFMDYFFESSSLIYNRPAKVEVDEPYMEYQEPSGFQVMEAMLFDENPFSHKKALMEQAELLSSSAADLNALLYGFEGTDKEMLESIRLELIKVITLSITGYDAPELKSGIEESYQSVAAIQQVLQPYLEYAASPRSRIAAESQESVASLAVGDTQTGNTAPNLAAAASQASDVHQASNLAADAQPSDIHQASKLISDTQLSDAHQAAKLTAIAQVSTTHQASNLAAELSKTLNETLVFLKLHPDFDQFNRIEFLTTYALPLQEQLGKFISSLSLSVNQKSNLNYEAKHIFSRDAIPATAFTAIGKTQTLKAALGKKLFFENALSGNLKRNCGSCHRTDRYFSDGLKTSLAFDGKHFVQRNAPSLLYAGFQYAQFWDGRVKTLKEQVKAVIENPIEMNGNHAVVIAGLKKDSKYLAEFRKAFPEISSSSAAGSSLAAPAGSSSAAGSSLAAPARSSSAARAAGSPAEVAATDAVNMDNLSDALAAYIMELAPMNSAFDQYIAGNKQAMTADQLKGFNLFMGKGQCGSCHFAPLFNGLIPPLYKRTEFEVLGTPANDDFEHLKNDSDPGRLGFFPIEYYQAAFKTPSVRNAAMTAPYMHNGVFKDLNKVVEFYNQGGGAGLHLVQPQQTLSAKPLHLSDAEVKQIVAFMESLTDKI